MDNFRFQTCPCCNSRDFIHVWKSKPHKVIRNWKDFFYGGRLFIEDISSCCSCGFGFINTINRDDYKWYSLQDIDVYTSMSSFRSQYFKDLKKEFIERFHPIFPDGAKALDLACGDGVWLELWGSHMKLFGTEACEGFRQILSQKRIELLNESQLEVNKFNLLSMFDFLEHVENPDYLVSKIWRMVQSGGFLIIGVPDMGKLASKILGTRYYLVCPMHYSYFDRRSLGTLLQRVCPDGDVSIFGSPSLRTDLNGMLKWVGVKNPVRKYLNVSFPIGYAASIIAVVRKPVSTN